MLFLILPLLLIQKKEITGTFPKKKLFRSGILLLSPLPAISNHMIPSPFTKTTFKNLLYQKIPT